MKHFCIGLLFIAGVILCTNEGASFPWVNMGGITLCALSVVWARV